MYIYFSDVEKVKEGIGDKLSFMIQYIAAFVSGFAIGFWKSWKMTLVMMSLTPLLAICASFLAKVNQTLMYYISNIEHTLTTSMLH